MWTVYLHFFTVWKLSLSHFVCTRQLFSLSSALITFSLNSQKLRVGQLVVLSPCLSLSLSNCSQPWYSICHPSVFKARKTTTIRWERRRHNTMRQNWREGSEKSKLNRQLLYRWYDNHTRLLIDWLCSITIAIENYCNLFPLSTFK